MTAPFQPMAAAEKFLRDLKETNEWKVDCTGDDDCIICREVGRLLDVFNAESGRAARSAVSATERGGNK